MYSGAIVGGSGGEGAGEVGEVVVVGLVDAVLSRGGLRRCSDVDVEVWSFEISESLLLSFSVLLALGLLAAVLLPLTFRRWCLRSRSLLRARTAEGARSAVGEDL